MTSRIAPVTRSCPKALPLPTLIANEDLRLDGWSDHVNSVVFFVGKALFGWQQMFDRSLPTEKQDLNSQKPASPQQSTRFSTELAPLLHRTRSEIH
ncbi:MAG: hypothetical protein DMF04_09405 [Verrucomicrobia bacterium]|nr:MAG: hypothetical protein DMF04_09405 [Verrucomicrobiota bacterium]